MIGFAQVLKPIKWQDLLEEEKGGRNAFRTGAKIHFSEKKYFGVRGTLKHIEQPSIKTLGLEDLKINFNTALA